ncbi:MAG: hypothetical protein ACTHU0_09825 [Kofleriaceae bacterium]
MPLFTNDTLPVHDGNQVKTAKNDESPRNALERYSRSGLPDTDPSRQLVDERVAVTRPGFGAPIQGQAKSWTTSVRWGPVEPASRDGTEVEATVLGPDHKLGEEPHKDACPNAGRLNDKLGKAANSGYVKGHLLNHNLGGPGNDDRNLAAIPRSTNTGGMKDHVETRLKTLVNDHKAWVYFKAKVTHGDWKTYKYAKKLEFWWHELKPDVHGDPEKAPGTEGTCVMDIPKPSHYDETDYSQPTNDHTKGVTKDGKISADPDPATAKAELPWNAIVLTDWEAVKLRKQVLDIAAVEIQTLGAADAQKMADYLCQAPEADEQAALDWIKKEVERCASDNQAMPDPQLATKAKDYEAARHKRLEVMLGHVDGFLLVKLGGGAATVQAKLRQALLTDDPLQPYREAIEMLVQRLTRLQQENDRLGDELAYADYNVMSPGTMDQFHEAYFEEQHDEATYDDKAKRVLGLVMGPKSGQREEARDTMRDLKKTKRRSSAETWLEVFKTMDASSAPLAELRALHPAAPNVHAQLLVYLEGTNAFVDNSLLGMLFEGLAKREPETYLAYSQQLRGIPELASAFASK